MAKKKNTGKIISTAFWVVMAVHIAVFTAIGFATSEWRLLKIFTPGAAAILAVKWIVRSVRAKRSGREK